jgi:hypothetical protein
MADDGKYNPLKDRRQKWLDILKGTDTHSVSNQLAKMAWDFAAFSAINEARRIAPPTPMAACNSMACFTNCSTEVSLLHNSSPCAASMTRSPSRGSEQLGP